MGEEKSTNLVIPALLAAAAAYFSFEKKGTAIGDLAKEAVGRVINDQTNKKNAKKPTVLELTDVKKKRIRYRRRHPRQIVLKVNNENTNNQV